MVPSQRRRMAFACLVLLVPCLSAWAIPRGTNPLPFALTDHWWYSAYWLAALAALAFAAIKSLAAAARSESRHLHSLFAMIAVNFLVQVCNFLDEYNYSNPTYDDATRLGACIGSCLLVILLPLFIQSHPRLALRRFLPPFAIAGGALLMHYVASAAWFFGTRWSPGLKYYDGHRILPALVLDFALVASSVYPFGLVLWSRGLRRLAARERLVVVRSAKVLILLAPVSFAVDNVRWLFPALWALYPQDDYFVLPAVLLAESVMVVAYVKAFVIAEYESAGEGDRVDAGEATLPAAAAILARGNPCEEKGNIGPNRLSPAGSGWDFEGSGLSPREREVAGLLLEGMTYQQIGALLFISLATVKTHVDRIYKKSGASNKMDLARIVRGA